MDPAASIASASDLAERLGETGYLCDEALGTIGFLALQMQRPLLLEGEPGTGKTALAEAIAQALDLPLIRLQCYEGIDASQALYDWDFPRQILHLRALEAAGGVTEVEQAEKSLFDERFLLARPVLRALRESPAVLLVDEIDRADDEFEAFLLEVEISSSCAVAPVTRCDQHRHVSVRVPFWIRRNEPGTELQPVLGLQGDVPRMLDDLGRGRDG